MMNKFALVSGSNQGRSGSMSPQKSDRLPRPRSWHVSWGGRH